MAKRKSSNYKPPFLMIRYIEELEEVEITTTQEKKQVTIPGDSMKNGTGEAGQNVSVNKINSIKEDNVNNNAEQASNRHGDIDTDKYRVGWAVIRPNDAIENANSVLPPGDTRKHILCKKQIIFARRNPNPGEVNGDGVDYIKPISGPDKQPAPGAIDYKTDRVEKFAKKRAGSPDGINQTKTFLHGDPTLQKYIGDDGWQVPIVDDSVPTDYVQVRYYYGDKANITGNEVTAITARASGDESTGGDPITVLRDGEQRFIDVNITKINVRPLNKQKIYTLDLYEIISYQTNNKKFGFGIERFDFSGDSRKTIQQTRGKINPANIDLIQDNFYVDAWWKGPETIVLSGVIELPYAYEEQVSYITETPSINRIKWQSFTDTMESFFSWNNNPMRINRGDKLQIVDYYKDSSSFFTMGPNKRDVYDVTFKNRRFMQSVDRPGLIVFEFTFIVLGRST